MKIRSGLDSGTISRFPTPILIIAWRSLAPIMARLCGPRYAVLKGSRRVDSTVYGSMKAAKYDSVTFQNAESTWFRTSFLSVAGRFFQYDLASSSTSQSRNSLHWYLNADFVGEPPVPPSG